MGQVTIRVNGYSHPVSCEDGQEQHLLQLAAEVDRKIASVKSVGGHTNEARLLLLAALVLADEVHDLRDDLGRAQAGQPPVARPLPDNGLADRLSRIAERIEGIAQTLEQP